MDDNVSLALVTQDGNEVKEVAVVTDPKGVITSVTIGYNRSLPKPAGFSKVAIEVTYAPGPGEVLDGAFIVKKLKSIQALVQSEVRKDK